MTIGKVKRFDFCFFIGETEDCQNNLKVLFHLENSIVLWYYVISCHQEFLSIPQMTFFFRLNHVVAHPNWIHVQRYVIVRFLQGPLLLSVITWTKLLHDSSEFETLELTTLSHTENIPIYCKIPAALMVPIIFQTATYCVLYCIYNNMLMILLTLE